MITGDYFFLIFLGTIAATRFFIALTQAPAPTIKGFRVRHYMYGIVMILVAFFSVNLTLFAVGFGLFIDELPPILVKGPGHKEEQWHGCDDYHSSWCVSGVLILVLVTFYFRDLISGLI